MKRYIFVPIALVFIVIPWQIVKLFMRRKDSQTV